MQWTSCDQVDKNLIYVLGNFDCPPFKKVAGNARYVRVVGFIAVTVYYVTEW